MKTKSLSLLVFLCLTLLCSCQKNTEPTDDIHLAENIEVKWELISNDATGKPQFRSAFTLTNHGEGTLGNSGWSIYFSFRDIFIKGTAPETIDISFIGGDFYKLSPADKFKLAPGQSITIPFDCKGSFIKDSNAPAGMYFVLSDRDGKAVDTAVIKNYTFQPLKPGQLPQDLGPIPDPEWRFNQNINLSKLEENDIPPIVPTPQEIKYPGGEINLNSQFGINYGKGLANEAALLAHVMGKILGSELSVEENDSEGPQIISLKVSPQSNNTASKEAYDLDISGDNRITIRGNDAAGVFYGIQSLLNLLPPSAYQIPQQSIPLSCLSIKDAPRFAYRGMHLDVSRNFFKKEAVFKLLDIMAFYKLNKFHFHLTDDEGWRLQIEELPELTEIGGFRGHTLDDATYLQPSYGSGPDPAPENSYGSGYYSREDYKAIIRYAYDRHIEVIPEFDMPGHGRAAIKSMENRYARLMKEGKETEANEYLLNDLKDQSEYMSAQDYTDNVVCVCMESVYGFFETVVDDVLEMHQEAGVPINTIHIGGDEVPEGVWQKSPICAQLIKENDQIESHTNLSNYFINRITQIFGDRDLTLAGWQEIALKENELQPKSSFTDQNVTIYSWDNFTSGNYDLGYKVANAGYPVVLCNATNLYFELAYDKDSAEPGDYFGGFIDTRKAFEFIPMDFLKSLESSGTQQLNDTPEMVRLSPAARENILGMQGHLWSEPIKGSDSLEYFYLPKLTGLAERAWAKQPVWATIENTEQRESALAKEWNSFANRVGQREMPRADYIFGGYNYRIPPPGAIVKDGMLFSNGAFPGLTIRYTTDGSDPTNQSEIYDQPVNVDGIIKLRTFDSRGRGSRISEVN